MRNDKEIIAALTTVEEYLQEKGYTSYIIALYNPTDEMSRFCTHGNAPMIIGLSELLSHHVYNVIGDGEPLESDE